VRRWPGGGSEGERTGLWSLQNRLCKHYTVNLRSYMSRLGRADGHSDGDEINGRQRAGVVQLLVQLLLMTETVVSEIADNNMTRVSGGESTAAAAAAADATWT